MRVGVQGGQQWSPLSHPPGSEIGPVTFEECRAVERRCCVNVHAALASVS